MPNEKVENVDNVTRRVRAIPASFVIFGATGDLTKRKL